MALQTLTSSTADQPAPTSTQPQPNPNDDLGTKNSIPFSFLIAFLALFVAFMAVGLWARRFANFVRRRLGLPIPEPPPRYGEQKPARPVIWDVSPAPGGDASRWNTMQASSVWR